MAIEHLQYRLLDVGGVTLDFCATHIISSLVQVDRSHRRTEVNKYFSWNSTPLPQTTPEKLINQPLAAERGGELFLYVDDGAMIGLPVGK